MDRLACKRQVWAALSSGGEQDLHQAVWDVTLLELRSGSCCYRKALLDALDCTAVAEAAGIIRLLQHYIRAAQAGSSLAQCFVGVLLCFSSSLELHGLSQPQAQGFRYLLSSHYQQNNMATLFLALCYEAARGTGRSVESALECYQTAFARGYQIAHIFFLESSRDHGASAAVEPGAASQVPNGLPTTGASTAAIPVDHQPASFQVDGTAAMLQQLAIQQPPPPPPPPASQRSSSLDLDSQVRAVSGCTSLNEMPSTNSFAWQGTQALQDSSLHGHKAARAAIGGMGADSHPGQDPGVADGWKQQYSSDLLHAARGQLPTNGPPDSPGGSSSVSVLQSSEDLLGRSLEDMLDGLEQVPASKSKHGSFLDEQQLSTSLGDGEVPLASYGPTSWLSGQSNGHRLQQGQREEGSDPWGNLQTGVVDWSIRPKGGRAASTAAVKPGSRSASPVPSAASARSLPNLNGLDTTRDHPEGPSSPPGSNPPELQSDLGPAPVGTEVGALSDQTFHTGTSGSRDSPVDSLADSSTGTHQGDKGGPQLGAAEPSTEEADKLQAALTRWCSSQQTTEDEAVILASDYIPADIKEAVCSDDLQVRRNMMSMLHALLFPGAELQASKPPQPAPPATQPGNGPGNAAHQQLGSAAVGTHKQPMPPPRRKPATGNGVFQPALPKQSSAAHRPPTSYLPGVGLPQAALPDPYSMQGRSAAQLMPPVQYGPAAGRQPPLGPVLQPGLRANQASEAQQAMLMQVLAQQNARAPELLTTRPLPGRGGLLPRNLRPAMNPLNPMNPGSHVQGPPPISRPRGLSPQLPMPAAYPGQNWAAGGGQLLPRPVPSPQHPMHATPKPSVDRAPLSFNNQAGLRGAQLLGSNGHLQNGVPDTLASQAAWLGSGVTGPRSAGMAGLAAPADWSDQSRDPLSLHLSASQQRLLQARAGLMPQQPAPPSRPQHSMGLDALSSMYLANAAAADRGMPAQGGAWPSNTGAQGYGLPPGQVLGSQLPGAQLPGGHDLASQLLGAGLPPDALQHRALPNLPPNGRAAQDLTGMVHSGGWSSADVQNLYSANIASGKLVPGLGAADPASEAVYSSLQGYPSHLQYNNNYCPT